MGKSTFYRHYRDIYDVFDELIEAFASRVIGIMIDIAFSDSVPAYSDNKNIISGSTAITLFGLKEADNVLVHYLFNVKSMKVFHLVVERFRNIIKEYAVAMNIDSEQADYYTRFVMNGILYSSLNDYIHNDTFNMELIKLLRSFRIEDWMTGGEDIG